MSVTARTTRSACGLLRSAAAPRPLPRAFFSTAVNIPIESLQTEPVRIPTPETRPGLPKSSNYIIESAAVVSRPPYLTPELHPFEESYYFYQQRLHQRLALPFTRYFYFKKDSTADLLWKKKQRPLRKAKAYTGFGPEGWKDELLIGDNAQHEEDFGYERLVETTVTKEDAVVEEGAEQEAKIVEKPLPRTTKADEENDLKSLDRAGSRTLYLLVKQNGRWQFPTSRLEGKENLRHTAMRTLEESCGMNMNTWFVGNVPIGHQVINFSKPKEGMAGAKTFFMKARIMAGQADLTGNELGVTDFVWVTKDELKDTTVRGYWESVRHMLATR
ncbi:hypothetical protein EX30DRAFT_338621 [Ascodesmis nigricans]|uniref:Large ribosomal subunit protein mL46 n=1 Tax=Ascodesmis nigricans TaxID=341454 RepID=A0A4S2N4G9_9PEZI|nr:hypothetical protein EX30DRAFT_338621 [Ascodesmis nigricans]